MQDYDVLDRYTREDGLTVIVDKTYETMHPDMSFEAADVKEICEKIASGTYDWFMLRVRVLLDGHEMGSEYLGGCCYEDAREVLTDGTAADLIASAVDEARNSIRVLRTKLDLFAD